MKRFFVILLTTLTGYLANAQTNTRTLYWNMGDQNWPTLSNGRSWNDRRNWLDQNGNVPTTNVTNGDLLVISQANADITITSSFTISYTNFLISVQGTAEITIKSGVDLTLSAVTATLALEATTSTNGLTLEKRSGSSNYTSLVMNGLIKAQNKSGSSINLTGSYSARGVEGLSEFGTGFGGFNFGSLPVLISRFSVTVKGSEVRLQWTVEQEINVKNYSIERSSDGQTWQEVAVLAATGFSQTAKEYTQADVAGSSGAWYYRVRANDLDGKRTYSSMQRVSVDASRQGSLAVYPNPATTYVNVVCTGCTGNVQIRLFNQSGQLQMQQSVNGGTGVARLDVSKLSNGYYIIDMVSGNGIRSQLKLILAK